MRLTAALLLAASLQAQTSGTRDNWPEYGGQSNAWRYSELDQVNRQNVKKLVPKWVFQTGVQDGGLQSTPIVLDGVMYVSTSWNRVYAIDAENGREIWSYHYKNPREIGIIYSPWNRGVAVGQGRVFMGTLDNHVVALDQRLDANCGMSKWNRWRSADAT